MTPLITVIIPCYNGAKYVHRCLDSIRRQSFRDLEVLLIDDGSTDDSVALAAEYTEVTVISNESNRGLAYTRNRGVQLAQGEYVHFLDVDDRVSSDYYLRMAESARTTGADIVIGGGLPGAVLPQSAFLADQDLHRAIQVLHYLSRSLGLLGALPLPHLTATGASDHLPRGAPYGGYPIYHPSILLR